MVVSFTVLIVCAARQRAILTRSWCCYNPERQFFVGLSGQIRYNRPHPDALSGYRIRRGRENVAACKIIVCPFGDGNNVVRIFLALQGRHVYSYDNIAQVS